MDIYIYIRKYIYIKRYKVYKYIVSRPKLVRGLGASHTTKLVQRRVAQAAHELAQAAPLVLILASVDIEGSAMIPLEVAAKNADFGAELVPVPWPELGGFTSGAGWKLGAWKKTSKRMNHDHSPFLLEFWERKQLDTCSAAKGIAYVLLICIGRQKPNWTSHQRTIFPCQGSTFRFSCNWIWRRQCFSLTKLQWLVTSSLIVHREQRVTEDLYELENIRKLFILQGYFLSAEPRCTAQTGPVVQRGDLDYRWLKSVTLCVYKVDFVCPSPSKTGPVRSVVASSSAFDHPLRSSVVPWGVSCCKARPLLQLPWCGRLFWRPSRDFRCIRTWRIWQRCCRRHSPVWMEPWSSLGWDTTGGSQRDVLFPLG